MPFNYSDSKQKNRFFLCNRYAKLFVDIIEGKKILIGFLIIFD